VLSPNQKPKINTRSAYILKGMNSYVCDLDYHDGEFFSLASNFCDNWYFRSELQNLIDAGVLCVDTKSEFDERRDVLCGQNWTVRLTEAAIKHFWKDRYECDAL